MEDKFIYKLSVGMVIFGLLIVGSGFLGDTVFLTDSPPIKTSINWLWVMIGGLIIALGFYLKNSNKKR